MPKGGKRVPPSEVGEVSSENFGSIVLTEILMSPCHDTQVKIDRYRARTKPSVQAAHILRIGCGAGIAVTTAATHFQVSLPPDRKIREAR